MAESAYDTAGAGTRITDVTIPRHGSPSAYRASHTATRIAAFAVYQPLPLAIIARRFAEAAAFRTYQQPAAVASGAEFGNGS